VMANTRKRKEPEIDQDFIDAAIKMNDIMRKAFDDMMAVLRPLQEKIQMERDASINTKKPKKEKEKVTEASLVWTKQEQSDFEKAMVESKGDPIKTKELMKTSRSLNVIKKRIEAYRIASRTRKVAIPPSKLQENEDEDDFN